MQSQEYFFFNLRPESILFNELSHKMRLINYFDATDKIVFMFRTNGISADLICGHFQDFCLLFERVSFNFY